MYRPGHRIKEFKRKIKRDSDFMSTYSSIETIYRHYILGNFYTVRYSIRDLGTAVINTVFTVCSDFVVTLIAITTCLKLLLKRDAN